MSIKVKVTKNLVFPQVETGEKEEVITLLANALEKEGFVKEAYREAILARETEYPTGLPSAMPAVAIPHADHELVKKTSIAVATLKNPVKFHNMEDVSQEIAVQIVIMMAIAEPHGQIEMLQKIIDFIQSDEQKTKLVTAADKEEMLKIIQKSILKEEKEI